MTRRLSLLLAVGGALALATGACTTTTSSNRQDAGPNDGSVFQFDGGGNDAGGDGPAGACTQSGFTAVEEYAEADTDYFGYSAYSSSASPTDQLFIEFYYGYGDPPPLEGPGTFELGVSPDEKNYATCGTCVLVGQGCDDNGCNKLFFATSGTLTVSSFATGQDFTGTLTNARLVEVTIDSSYTSTPVAGGDTWCLTSYSFDAPIEGTLSCSSNTECAGSTDTPYCDTASSTCVQCLEESHCASLTATPHCDTDYFTCVECVDNAQCASSTYGAFCVDNQCGACATPFDCTNPTAPACVTSKTTNRAECGVVDECTGDDAGDNNDDGPAGARALSTSAASTGAVCDASGEADWYKFDVAAIGSATFTLTWTITNTSNPEDLDLEVYDANGNLLGQSWYGEGTEAVALTYLPVGTYYAVVSAYDVGDATAPVPYSLAVTAGTGTCANDADCATVYSHQYLRGKCQVGACVFIDGAGALTPGAACDSLDDCASGLCTYGGATIDYNTFTFIDYHYMAGADTRGYCVADTCSTSTDCVSPQVCSMGFCLPKCTDSAQCPVVSGGTTVALDGWEHATCNTSTGVCEY
jgi:hypothetical protein